MADRVTWPILSCLWLDNLPQSWVIIVIPKPTNHHELFLSPIFIQQTVLSWTVLCSIWVTLHHYRSRKIATRQKKRFDTTEKCIVVHTSSIVTAHHINFIQQTFKLLVIKSNCSLFAFFCWKHGFLRPSTQWEGNKNKLVSMGKANIWL